MKAKRMVSILMVVCCLFFATSLAQAQLTLPVLFKAQVPPGTWFDTSNCGQASVAMAIAYHKKITPTETLIKQIDDWLHTSQWQLPINNYNSSSTKPWILEDVAAAWGFPDSYWQAGWTLQDLKNAIDKGLPVVCRIVASYLTNRGYGYTGKHYILAIGYDSASIICHDPGSARGALKHYSNYDMTRAMTAGFQSSEDGSVTVVVPNTTPPPLPPPPVEETFPVTVDGTTWNVPIDLIQELTGWLDANGKIVE